MVLILLHPPSCWEIWTTKKDKRYSGSWGIN